MEGGNHKYAKIFSLFSKCTQCFQKGTWAVSQLLSHDIKVLQTKQGGWRCAAEAAPGKEVPALGSSRRAWLGEARPRQTSVWQPQGLQRWTASRRAAAPLGKMSRSKREGGKNPRGASGEWNPLSRTSPGFGCCKWGRDAAVQQPGPQQQGLQPPSPTKPCCHLSGSSLSPKPLHPATPPRDSPQRVTAQPQARASATKATAPRCLLPVHCSLVPPHPSHTYTGHTILPNCHHC